MNDRLAAEVVRQGDDAAIRAILDEACRVTGMGFAAVARVTDSRWIAAQVLDRIEFGLDPGDELEIKTTLCNDIRQSGEMIVIDHVGAHDDWRMHSTPMMYGFESYASVPIFLADGGFYGTLCAIDPAPRPALSGAGTVAALSALAVQLSAILTQRVR